jgi:hypothetical protein
MTVQLDTLLDVAPDAIRPLTVIEQAADIIQAEIVDEIPAPTFVAPPVLSDPHVTDLNADVDYARDQIKNVIDDGRIALNGIMELAAAGEEPRAYEVMAELMGAIIAANKELILVHKVRKETLKVDKEARQADGAATPINIDKAVFFGRASDLLRELHAIKVQTAAALTAKTIADATES